MPAALGAPCSTRYRAAHDSGRRTQPVLWVVLHCTQSATAASAARWLADPRATGSAHLVVGGTNCYRLLPNDLVAWGAPGANESGFHVEQAGFADWSEAEWLARRPMLKRVAWKVARHCHVFGVPPVFVTADGLRRKHPGITTHAECSRAFGGDHTDPGRGWPRRYVMGLVRDYYADLLAELQQHV